jgi:hypothetical protein
MASGGTPTIVQPRWSLSNRIPIRIWSDAYASAAMPVKICPVPSPTGEGI